MSHLAAMSVMSVNGESGRYVCLYWIVNDSISSTLHEFNDSFNGSDVTSVVLVPVDGLGNTRVRIEHDQH